MPVPETVKQLVQRFEEYRNMHCSGKYNETQSPRMLELHKQSPRTSQESAIVRREIEAMDMSIDKLVYELYGLSEDEIRIVEGA